MYSRLHHAVCLSNSFFYFRALSSSATYHLFKLLCTLGATCTTQPSEVRESTSVFLSLFYSFISSYCGASLGPASIVAASPPFSPCLIWFLFPPVLLFSCEFFFLFITPCRTCCSALTVSFEGRAKRSLCNSERFRLCFEQLSFFLLSASRRESCCCSRRSSSSRGGLR